MSLVYSIYALVTNIIASNVDLAKDVKALTNNLNIISLISKIPAEYKTTDNSENEDMYEIQCWIGLAVVIIWCLLFFVLKYFEKEEEVRV